MRQEETEEDSDDEGTWKEEMQLWGTCHEAVLV
jgi:hypothetical protein